MEWSDFIPGFKCQLFFAILFGSLVGVITPALGREDLIVGSRYTSAQIAALGDSAFSSGEEMASGLFYNPANLGKTKQFTIGILNYSITGSAPLLAGFGLDSLSIGNLQAFSPIMVANPGKIFGSGYSFFPTISLPFLTQIDPILPCLTFGILAQSEFSGVSTGNGALSYRSVAQLIPAMGLGFSFFDGALRFGYSLQFVSEAVGSQTSSSLSALNYANGLTQGSALSHNMGISYRGLTGVEPVVSVVARNIGNATYSSLSLINFTNQSTGVPASDLMSFDAAVAFRLRIASGLMSNWSIAYRDISDASNVPDILAHVGAGVEFAFLNGFFLRLGYRTRYFSAGVGIKRTGAELSLARYTEEVGTHFLDQGDSKYILQYQLALY